MNNQKQPAHPLAPLQNGERWDASIDTTGLTKLEYFTAAALNGLAAKYTLKEPSDQNTIAQMAIELAQTTLATMEAIEIAIARGQKEDANG